MARTLTRWTVADYHRMIAEGFLAGRQVELIDGQIVEMAPELPIHRATYRRGVRYDYRHPGPDDIYWLIEVSNSTLAYDLGEKAQIYARDNIKEYWVIDIQGNQLWIHRDPQGNQYLSITQLKSGTLSPVEIPNISVQVEKLFT